MIPQLTELEVQLAGPQGEAVRQASVQALLALLQRLQDPSGERPLDLREVSTFRAGIESALAILKTEVHSA